MPPVLTSSSPPRADHSRFVQRVRRRYAAELQPLFARMHDTWLTAAGPGFTYPADTPAERIDYVFVSPNAKVDTAFVPVVPAASDHRPVVVELSFGRS